MFKVLIEKQPLQAWLCAKRLMAVLLLVPFSLATLATLTSCTTLNLSLHHQIAVVSSDNQTLTGRFAFILEQGQGKQRIARLVTSNLDGSHAQVLTQVNGTLSNLSASGDGKTLIFTQQQTSFPGVYTYNLSSGQKTLLTPQRTNHFSGSLSPDSQKVLLSSSLNQNPEIFLANTDGTQLEQLTVNKAVDIGPSWSPDQQWFVFTSDRSGLYHPQLYRYDFADKKVSRIATTGGYNANARISPNGEFISYITKLDNGEIQRMLKRLATDETWAMSDNELTEAINFSPMGNYGVYSTQQAIEVASLPKLNKTSNNQPNHQQIRPIYQLALKQIQLPVSYLEHSLIREPIWLP